MELGVTDLRLRAVVVPTLKSAVFPRRAIPILCHRFIVSFSLLLLSTGPDPTS
jgi:hypothetical protein